MVKELAPDAHARIARAIAAAEAATSGEVFCVLARRVSSYRDVALLWSAAAALILPIALIPFGFIPDLPTFGWEAANVAPAVLIGQSLLAYALVQALVFGLAYAFTCIPGVRRVITPRSIRRARVRRAAVEQFLAHGLHVTEARTGVLIFASLSDHQVEVVADEGIHARVDDAVWADAAEALADGMKADDPAAGFERAIALCGEVLAAHFPPRPDNPNEVADRLVVI
ncbi:TPM domain-containing protein [Brevundimonas sp. NPDC092305]|uniref:TPM domain-containing protein n=1 Tax=Brevundimonas sp. NPDC092305 TaxID=3363957 RepID=UPI00380AF319